MPAPSRSTAISPSILEQHRQGLARPQSPVVPGVKFAFDWEYFRDGADISHRIEKTYDSHREIQHYLVADASDHLNQWFAIETDLSARSKRCVLRIKGYPVRRIFPRLLYVETVGSFPRKEEPKFIDLPDFQVSEVFRDVKIDLPTLPDSATDVKISLNVPENEWFVVGLMFVKEYTDA